MASAQPDPKSVDATISCRPSHQCVAVGDAFHFVQGPRDEYLVQRPLAEHWDGTKWAILPTPLSNGDFGGISCWSAAGCAAVGQVNDLSSAEYWNGTAWTSQATPNPVAAGLSDLTAVSCTESPSTCIAVGVFESGYTLSHALAERFAL